MTKKARSPSASGCPTRSGFIQFRVYCGPRDGRGLFVHARIFATKREMMATLRAESKGYETGGRWPRHTAGAMQCTKLIKVFDDGSSRASPSIGRVNFYRRCLGTEVITHEFAHAMFSYGERKRVRLDLADRDIEAEELLCYAHGRMCRRFVGRALKLGLY